MISDEERREVAKRLRGLDATITNRDTLEQAVDKFMKAVRGDIPFSPIRYSVRNLCGLAGILADLIDRPSTTRHGKFRTKYGRETPCCEVCGYSIGDMRWGYCPKCGAEVVS